MKETAWVPNY